MSMNERIETFKKTLTPIIEKTNLTEQELFDLIVTGSLVIRHVTYPSLAETINEIYIKTKFNLK